jgi:hypothetical protein
MTAPADEFTATAVLQKLAPGWGWLRENFKLPPVLAIAGLLVSSGAWIYSQHTDIQSLKKRDPKPQLDRIESQLSQILQQQAGMRVDLANQAQRIARQEAQWDRVTQVAETPTRRRSR